MLKTVRIRQEGQLSLSYSVNWRYWETLMENTSQFPHLPFVCPIKQAVCVGYYAMSGTSQKNSKIQKFKNSTVEKKNISLVQLTNAAISLLN